VKNDRTPRSDGTLVVVVVETAAKAPKNST
jgi:hypothetical protein